MNSAAARPPGASLARRLGTRDAVAIGLGSMLGAGVFAVFAPAAEAAGTWLLVGLALAAIVAWCNGLSSAQLAAQYPESGGAYVYGRRELGAWPGFLAGWSFIVGKTASCAAMALTIGVYLAPHGWDKAVALVAVACVTIITGMGVTRTARATTVIVVVVIAVLALVVVAAVASGTADASRIAAGASPHGAYGVLQAAGLIFFAFAGYARIATMGEEVRAPRRTIPRAIVISLGLALAIYLVVAVTALATLGPEALANSAAPLADVAASGGWAWTATVVRCGAALAAAGALLALLAGITRTALAMARSGDLPEALARVHPGARVPRTAAIVFGVLVATLVAVADVRFAIAFSSFGVLLYYLVGNVSALRQRAPYRRYPRVVQAGGAFGCVVLAATLPATAIAIAAAVLLVGVAYRGITLWSRARAARPQ